MALRKPKETVCWEGGVVEYAGSPFGRCLIPTPISGSTQLAWHPKPCGTPEDCVRKFFSPRGILFQVGLKGTIFSELLYFEPTPSQLEALWREITPLQLRLFQGFKETKRTTDSALVP